MNKICLFFIFLIPGFLDAQEVRIIQKGTHFGLVGTNDIELIPPVYDNIGWSVGEPHPFGDLIGYKENGKWGLINMKNKRVTPPSFYKLVPFDSSLILCAIQGKFSNELFHGIIDSQGKTQISCNYFSIDRTIQDAFTVGDYDNGQVRYGLISSDYELLVPTEFIQIRPISERLVALQTRFHNWKIFDLQESRMIDLPLLDSFERNGDHLLCVHKGAKGIITADGEIVRSPDFKEITINSPITTTSFASWEIWNDSLQHVGSLLADSLTLEHDLITYHRNGVPDLFESIPFETSTNSELQLTDQGFFIERSRVNRKWSVYNEIGTKLISNKDSIHFTGSYFLVLSGSKWLLYNKYGRLISKRKYEALAEEIHNIIPAQLNRYWGLIDFQGVLQVRHKYDTIIPGPKNRFIVKYLEYWGMIDAFGDWHIHPDYDSLYRYEEVVIGRKNNFNQILDPRGDVLFDTDVRLDTEKGFIQLKQDDRYGLVSPSGTLIAYPIYEEVLKMGERYIGKRDERAVLWDEEGNELIDMNDRYEDILSFSEGYFLIKKDRKYGFVDQSGNLRIANRYDEAKPLCGGMAAIKLRGKWGFVDSYETLSVQPFFDYVGEFKSEAAIIRKDGRYGLVDKGGNLLIKPKYKSITLTSDDSFILNGDDQKKGLVSKEGQILLQPDYDDIQDVGDGRLIVNRRGLIGMMNSDAYTLIDFNFKSIQVNGPYYFLQLFD